MNTGANTRSGTLPVALGSGLADGGDPRRRDRPRPVSRRREHRGRVRAHGRRLRRARRCACCATPRCRRAWGKARGASTTEHLSWAAHHRRPARGDLTLKSREFRKPSPPRPRGGEGERWRSRSTRETSHLTRETSHLTRETSHLSPDRRGQLAISRDTSAAPSGPRCRSSTNRRSSTQPPPRGRAASRRGARAAPRASAGTRRPPASRSPRAR